MIFLFTLDRAYLIPATVAIFSLLKNHPDRQLKIYLITGEDNPSWIAPLLALIDKMKTEAVLLTVNPALLHRLKVNTHFGLSTYFRVFAADLIEEDKIIYLDSDVIVDGSLEDLWDTPMGTFPIAAVEDLVIRDYDRLDLLPSQGYFNSGVLLINLPQWRAIDLRKNVLEFVREFPSKIIYSDQCSLNAILKGNWIRLSPKWNLQSGFFDKKSEVLSKVDFPYSEIEAALASPVIVHFTGLPKPWSIGSKHKFKPLFWKYLNETPYSGILPLDFSILNLVKSFFPLSVKKHYWRYLKRKESITSPTLNS